LKYVRHKIVLLIMLNLHIIYDNAKFNERSILNNSI